MNIKKKRVTTLYVLILSISILSCGCQYIKDSKNPKVISNNKGNLAKNLDNKICVYYISLSSFRLSEVVCEDVSCYALGEKESIMFQRMMVMFTIKHIKILKALKKQR